jgi:hypothetical protein
MPEQGRFVVGAGLAACSSTLCDASPRDMASGSTGHASRTILTEPPGLGPITALLGQDSEVAQREVAVDALVDATELVGTLQGQDPPPAGFGLRRLAGLAVQRGLAEMQLGVVWVHPQALGTSVQSLREVSKHLVAAGDQGEELPHDGIGGGRPGQAALKVPERCGPVLSFDGDRAQVEERL